MTFAESLEAERTRRKQASCAHHYVAQYRTTGAHPAPVECVHCGRVAYNTFASASRCVEDDLDLTNDAFGI